MSQKVHVSSATQQSIFLFKGETGGFGTEHISKLVKGFIVTTLSLTPGRCPPQLFDGKQAIISYLQNHLIQHALALWLESPI